MSAFELTFDPVKHVYKLNGKRLTSVTTVLGAGIPKPQLIDWAARVAAQFAVDNPGAPYEVISRAHKELRDKAAVRGTAVHNLAEDLIHGRAVEVPEELAPFIDGYLNFLDAFQVTPLLTEKTVLLRDLNVAGRFDLIGTSPLLNDGNPFIADIKTSSGVYRETAAQMAAYALADGWVGDDDPNTLSQIPYITASYVIHVTEDGTEVHPFATNADELNSDYDYFLAAHHIYKRSLAAHKVKEPLAYPATSTTAA